MFFFEVCCLGCVLAFFFKSFEMSFVFFFLLKLYVDSLIGVEYLFSVLVSCNFIIF